MKFSAKASLALWQRRLKRREKLLAAARKRARSGAGAATPGTVTKDEAAVIHKREQQVAEAKRTIAKRTERLAASQPLRLRAYAQAEALIGVMEQGGNNRGEMVMKIIRANQGTGPEAWCGDFMAYVYRAAGSKAVTRAWAAVRLLAWVLGIKKTTHPLRGDLVRFTFDHVGMFDKDNGDGTITTIEGNTGASGAVSDSTTGGDGVYRKVRSKQLVQDYLRVTR